MLDLRRLQLLREVSTRGTVHAAARALGYTPSAVSQQLAVLEREAGTPLFERVGRNLQLTTAGGALVRHANALLDGVEAAEAELATIAAGRVAGTVRVSAFQSAFLTILAPAIARLAGTHPDVTVVATELEIEQAATAVRVQQLDIAVGDEYAGQPANIHADLLREPLLDEQIRLLLPDGHPLAVTATVPLGRLSGLPWAACQEGNGQRDMLLRVCRQFGGFEPDIRYSSDDLLILLELVRTTGACTLLPDLVLRYGAPGVEIRSAADGAVRRAVFLLTRRARTPATAVVAEALRAAAGSSSQHHG